MNRYFWILLLPFLYLASLGIAIPPVVYVANSGSNNVSAIDTSNNQLIATIGVGNNPQQLAISPNGKYVYVGNYNDNTVSVIATKSNTLVATIFLLAGSGPEGIALSPDGLYLYVTNSDLNSVSVFKLSGKNATLITTISVGSGPNGLAVTPDGLRAYVVNYADATISVIDTTSNLVTNTINSPVIGPYAVAITPKGNYAYITNYDSSTVSVIDTKTNTFKTIIDVSPNFPQGIAITPDGQYAYIGSAQGPITVIEISNNIVFTMIPLFFSNSSNIAIALDGRDAYVTLVDANVVEVIGIQNNMVVDVLPVETFPVGIAIMPLLPARAFSGKQIYKEACGGMPINKLVWKPSRSSIEGYHLFRNGILLATLSATVVCYEDCSPNQNNVYTLIAFNAAGSTSMSVFTTVNDSFWFLK